MAPFVTFDGREVVLNSARSDLRVRKCDRDILADPLELMGIWWGSAAIDGGKETVNTVPCICWR